jgi:thiol-disulfide isomerase/thioredoxin
MTQTPTGSDPRRTPRPQVAAAATFVGPALLTVCAVYLWYAVLQAPPSMEGRPAPDFTLHDRKGNAVSLSDFRGKPVLISFWAVNCPPCRVKFPHVESLAERHGQGLTVLLVNAWGEPHDLVDAYVAGKVAAGIVLYDGQDAARRYGIQGIPETVLVDARGNIVRARDAFDPDRPAEFDRLLETAR